VKGTVEDRMICIIAEQFSRPRNAITRDLHLFNDLGADSLDAIEIVMEAEEEFDIDIHDAEVENLKTVGEMIDLANRLVG